MWPLLFWRLPTSVYINPVSYISFDCMEIAAVLRFRSLIAQGQGTWFKVQGSWLKFSILVIGS